MVLSVVVRLLVAVESVVAGVLVVITVVIGNKQVCVCVFVDRSLCLYWWGLRLLLVVCCLSVLSISLFESMLSMRLLELMM